MIPQCAMRNHRFIRSTTCPVSCRGRRRISLLSRSSKLCSSMNPSVDRDQHPVRPANPFHHGMIGARVGLHVHGPDGIARFRRAFVALAAGFAEVGGIHRRARIGGPENIVNAVARSAVRCRQVPALQRQAMITVRIRRHAVCRQDHTASPCARCAWQRPQVSAETLAAFTGEAGFFGSRIRCSPWQSTQTGASFTPALTASP